MYETINYLNNKCELLVNEKQILLKEIDEVRARNTGNNEEENTDIAEYLIELEMKARELGCENLSTLFDNFYNMKT